MNERSFIEASSFRSDVPFPGGVRRTHDLQTECPSCRPSAPAADIKTLPLGGSDDSARRGGDIKSEIPHATSEAVIPELPESDSPPGGVNNARIPPALPPGIRQGTAHPTVAPARIPKLHLRIARCIHPLPGGMEGRTHVDRCRASARGERGIDTHGARRERERNARGR